MKVETAVIAEPQLIMGVWQNALAVAATTPAYSRNQRLSIDTYTWTTSLISSKNAALLRVTYDLEILRQFK